MFFFLLIVVSLTELLPIASLIITNAFFLKQESMIIRGIDEVNESLIEGETTEDSDIMDLRPQEIPALVRVKTIHNLFANELKNKKLSRQIFWTYHFFEYLDDFIDGNTQAETSQNKEGLEVTVNFNIMAQARKMNRSSTRKRKDLMRNLDSNQKDRIASSVSSSMAN